MVRRGYGWRARVADAVLRRVDAARLTPGALEAAADRAGPDLAPDEVAEPLALLCEDLAQTPPTSLGGRVVRAALVAALVTRRHLQRLPAARPHEPVVVVGWYRTGTTYLQSLLDALPGRGFVPLHRLAAPVGGGALKAAAGIRLLSALAPELPQLHPLAARGPEECWMLLSAHLLVDGFAVHWETPRFLGWLRRVDRRPAYRTWAHALAFLETELGHDLVLKDPAHLLALPALLAAAPDARLVWTHRDPATCVGSYARLTAVQHRTVYGGFDAARVGRVCLERTAFGLAKGHADRALVPPGQLADVAFADLVADPVGTVERVCAALDLRFDGDAVRRRAAALADRGAPHPWDLADWGLDEAQVRAAVPSG